MSARVRHLWRARAPTLIVSMVFPLCLELVVFRFLLVDAAIRMACASGAVIRDLGVDATK